MVSTCHNIKNLKLYSICITRGCACLMAKFLIIILKRNFLNCINDYACLIFLKRYYIYVLNHIKHEVHFFIQV